MQLLWRSIEKPLRISQPSSQSKKRQEIHVQQMWLHWPVHTNAYQALEDACQAGAAATASGNASTASTTPCKRVSGRLLGRCGRLFGRCGRLFGRSDIDLFIGQYWPFLLVKLEKTSNIHFFGSNHRKTKKKLKNWVKFLRRRRTKAELRRSKLANLRKCGGGRGTKISEQKIKVPKEGELFFPYSMSVCGMNETWIDVKCTKTLSSSLIKRSRQHPPST